MVLYPMPHKGLRPVALPWAAARSARILIFDSVAERPRYDDEGEHYEEDRVMPIVFGARRPPRVADKPVWL